MSAQYAETAMLLAALDGDTDRVTELAADTLPGERRALRRALAVVEEALVVADSRTSPEGRP